LITIGRRLDGGCGGHCGCLEVGHEERGILLQVEHLLVEQRGGIRIDGVESERGILGGGCLARQIVDIGGGRGGR